MTPETIPDSEPVEVTHIILGGPNDGKGKNKRAAEDILSVEQEPWVEQEVKFGPTDKAICLFQNNPIVISIR